tara:strand:+ start:1674 stop:2357 length:684 start_codon:yes stop_codon:yes gene_type:complete
MNMVHVSTMSGKLEGFKSISSNTVINKFCFDKYTTAKVKNKKAGRVVDICGVCYSQIMLNSYRKNIQPALDRNEKLAERLLEPHDLPTYLLAFMRYDAHGELLTEKIDPVTGTVIKTFPKYNHIENYCKIAEHNPHCNFALWTKRTDIIKPFFDSRPKPANLILIYSNPKVGTILAKPPKHFDRTFNNVLAHEFVDEQNCTGQKCKDCLLCYKHNGVTTIVEKVKKY